jgi:hypothetical protein
MKRWVWLIFACCVFQSASAEQVEILPDFDVHYVVLNTLFLKPEVATHYGITRAENRAIVNLSVLDKNGTPTTANVHGTYKNLLSQTFSLAFTEHREGTAVYYIAEIRYTDGDVLTFSISVATGDGAEQQFDFAERMYAERQR